MRVMVEKMSMYVLDDDKFAYWGVLAKKLKKPIYKFVWDETNENVNRKYDNVDINMIGKGITLEMPLLLEETKRNWKVKIEKMEYKKLKTFNEEKLVPLCKMVHTGLQYKKELEYECSE